MNKELMDKLKHKEGVNKDRQPGRSIKKLSKQSGIRSGKLKA